MSVRKPVDVHPQRATIYASDKQYAVIRDDSYLGPDTTATLQHLNAVARATGISLGKPPRQTTAEWLRAEQEKHWDIF